MSEPSDSLLSQYDALLLDLDGVVYVGDQAVVDAVRSLNLASSRGAAMAYVTNNASRTPEAVAAHLNSLGLSARPGDVATSAQAGAAHVARMLNASLAPGAPSPELFVDTDRGPAVLVVGGEGLHHAVRDQGLLPVSRLEQRPLAVLMGFGPQVGWADLAEATYAVASGLPFVATNVDLTVPTARGRAPGNGTLVHAVSVASGVEPVVVGKPQPALFDHAAKRLGALRPLVVGDRLDTDISGAIRANMDSLLVMTGVTDALALVHAPPEHRPTHLALTLANLFSPPARPTSTPAGRSISGQVEATVEGDTVAWRVVRATHDSSDGTAGLPVVLDALRAVTAAAWASDSDVRRIEPPLVIDPRDPHPSG